MNEKKAKEREVVYLCHEQVEINVPSFLYKLKDSLFEVEKILAKENDIANVLNKLDSIRTKGEGNTKKATSYILNNIKDTAISLQFILKETQFDLSFQKLREVYTKSTKEELSRVINKTLGKSEDDLDFFLYPIFFEKMNMIIFMYVLVDIPIPGIINTQYKKISLYAWCNNCVEKLQKEITEKYNKKMTFSLLKEGINI